jgi:hypothetical protein
MTIDLILFPDILSDEIVSSRWNTSQSIRLIQTVNDIETFVKGKNLTSQYILWQQ